VLMAGVSLFLLYLCFFFFQAEDGIRDFHVTGVQTCALPISSAVEGRGGGPSRCPAGGRAGGRADGRAGVRARGRAGGRAGGCARSEERRVGKEGRWRWSP